MTEIDPQIEVLIISYLSGSSTPEEKENLVAWIAENEKHKEYYLQLKNIWEIAHPAFMPQDIEMDKAHKKVMKKLDFSLQYRSIYSYWKYIAAILILAFLGMAGYLYIDKVFPAHTLANAYQEVMAPYGTRSFINLPDGSKVWLNAGSSLRFPLHFVEGKRNVWLKGEAFFEIKSDQENPFTVTTSTMKVQATGTAFNVDAYATDSVTAVTMVRGKVKVYIGESTVFPIQPGERVSYNSDLKKYKIHKTDPYKWYAWKDGSLVFRDDPLEYVFKRIGQVFNVDIRVVDKEIARHPYHATFEEESLDEILNLLKLTVPIRYEKSKREIDANNSYKKQQIRVYKLK